MIICSFSIININYINWLSFLHTTQDDDKKDGENLVYYLNILQKYMANHFNMEFQKNESRYALSKCNHRKHGF